MAKKTAKKADSDEFAVIETGGKQYSVAVGDIITVERNADGLKEGDKVTFENVLIVDNGKDTTIGTPYIEKAKVEGVFESYGRAKKVDVVKYKAKSRYFKQKGHRQPFMKVKIEAIR
ncbi:MAG: 50S ribosomal protein L21 [Candidatus Paceibacterota bacterium]